jgi:hypothetical protein
MVDRVARNKFAELLRHFVAGNLTNHEYEDAACGILNPINERRLQRMGSWDLWPFFRQADYESELGRPRLPGGNPH